MYLADSSRGLSLFAVHPQSYPTDPYVATLGSEDSSASLRSAPS